ncbi:MAG TPA: DNA-3-methyladenine glycosylase 2 family protein, partial [Candidatus Dormibacteraeota bacterium]|nr:DNA-3-methyladenine glycosylase 2 family protein [Candidatus Dormibacteraeota bacterium]
PWPQMRVPPSGEVLAAAPYWRFHALGVERRRADVLRLAGARAGWLEGCATMPMEDASARLRSLPGVGPWTAAQVLLNALGFADAVVVGDYNLPHLVTWALARERRGDDARMLELLAPYAGHRARVQRLLVLGHTGPPRRAPHMAIRDFAGY